MKDKQAEADKLKHQFRSSKKNLERLSLHYTVQIQNRLLKK